MAIVADTKPPKMSWRTCESGFISIRDYQEFRARGRFSSLADETFAEDDGELGLGLDIEPRKAVGKLLQKRFLRVEDPTSIEPWRALLAQNTVGPTPPSTPVFIAQGMVDDTVVPSVTLAY
jgi:hypothetical protein